jgi:hypothetical protein
MSLVVKQRATGQRWQNCKNKIRSTKEWQKSLTSLEINMKNYKLKVIRFDRCLNKIILNTQM